MVLSQFEFFLFTDSVFDSFFFFNLSFWVFSQYKLFSSHNLSSWVDTINFFEFRHNLSFFTIWSLHQCANLVKISNVASLDCQIKKKITFVAVRNYCVMKIDNFACNLQCNYESQLYFSKYLWQCLWTRWEAPSHW